LALSWGIGGILMGTIADFLGFEYVFLMLIISRVAYLASI
jgi:hypothetical protein